MSEFRRRSLPVFEKMTAKYGLIGYEAYGRMSPEHRMQQKLLGLAAVLEEYGLEPMTADQIEDRFG